MPRKGPVPKREVVPDPLYGSVLVSQVINRVLQRGKKGLAERIVYGAFDILKQKTGDDPIAVLKKAIENTKPKLEVRSRRVGGATYQVPVEVSNRRSTTLAIRWIVTNAVRRKEKTAQEKLAGELLDAYNNQGSSIKKKEDMHKMAEANRAFAHYRW